MKKINLFILLILISVSCTGCTRYLVAKYDDYNELYTGTITSNIQNKPIVTIKSESSGLVYSGVPGITSFTPFNSINPIYKGLEGASYLKSDNNTKTYINWKISNFKLKTAIGYGEDIYGHKVSFYFDFNKKNADAKLKQYKLDVANKPLLKSYNPLIVTTDNVENDKKTSEELYMRKLQKEIESNWSLQDISKKSKVVTKFDIDKLGSISNIKIIQSSGSELIDNGAIRAIVSSSPVEPLPNILKGQKCSILFTFNSPDGNIFTQDGDIYLKTYMKNINNILKSNWQPPKLSQNCKVIIFFTIDKQGTIKDIKFSKSSTNVDFNNSVINAIKEVSPLPPLPVEFPNENIDIKFVFESHVYQ